MKDATWTQYFAVFLFILIALLFPLVALLFGKLVRPSKPEKVKSMPYECGMDPVGDARDRYPVRYYIIALLFLIFDVETIFLFPWAVVYAKDTAGVMLFLFLEMAVFLAIVIIGYIYVWKKGALKWV